MRVAFGLLTIALAFAGARPLGAQSLPAPINEARGLGAVGRLDFGDLAFCTGALISPELVLTAAHCLYDPEGRAFDASEIRFLAGARQGRALATRWIERVILHPSYDDVAGSAGDERARASDLALLLLDAPIADPRVVPFTLGALPLTGERVSVISYAFDRPEVPVLEDSCVVLEQQSGVLVLSCDVDFGASGAPVLLRRQGKFSLVSLIAAKAETAGRKVAVGLKLDAPLAELLQQIDPAQQPPTEPETLPTPSPR